MIVGQSSPCDIPVSLKSQGNVPFYYQKNQFAKGHCACGLSILLITGSRVEAYDLGSLLGELLHNFANKRSTRLTQEFIRSIDDADIPLIYNLSMI